VNFSDKLIELENNLVTNLLRERSKTYFKGGQSSASRYEIGEKESDKIIQNYRSMFEAFLHPQDGFNFSEGLCW
jgi:hypothetical protein